MLYNDFFFCENSVEAYNEYTCTVTFNPAHAIFNGHFPAQPVVPGVCIMEMVKEIMQLRLGVPLLLSAAPVVKFLRLVLPHYTPRLHIQWQKKEGQITCNANLAFEGQVIFKMNACLS